MSLVAERKTSVRLAFTEGQLVLEAGQGDNAQASEAIEATLNGDDISTAFNPQFLIDGLQVLDTDTCASASRTPRSRPSSRARRRPTRARSRSSATC